MRQYPSRTCAQICSNSVTSLGSCGCRLNVFADMRAGMVLAVVPMMFRSVTLFTAMSLFSAIVSTTAHAGDDAEGESDVVAVPETPPGAAPIAPPSMHPGSKIGPQPVAREVLIGAGTGAIVTVGVGAIAFLALLDGEREQTDNAAIGLGLGLAAYPLGAGLGVAIVGTRGDVYGSVKNTIAGAYLGSVGGALLCGLVGHAIAPAEGAGASVGVLFGYLAGAPIGAAIAWNTTLEDHGSGTGLINVSGNRTHLSIPAISVTSDPLRPQGMLASVRLMDGRF